MGKYRPTLSFKGILSVIMTSQVDSSCLDLILAARFSSEVISRTHFA